MKRIVNYIAAAALVAAAALTVVSCGPVEEFDETLIHGTWNCSGDWGDGTETVRDTYNPGGSGTRVYVTNGAPDKPFTWELSGSRLTLSMETTNIPTRAAVPRDYTVTTLTETKLVYKSGSGNTFTCTK